MPAEHVFHQQLSTDPAKRWKSIPPVLESLKAKAKQVGLWNLWLSGGEFQHLAQGSGKGLTNLEYAVLAEISGHSHLCPEAMNCSAPDTGNMEVIARFGTDAQKDKYLKRLVNGEIRSAFAMTEYGIASSDASNLRNTTVTKRADGKLVLKGHKWWISGAGDPRCSVHVVVAVTDPSNPDKYKRHTIFLVDPKTPGVEIVRPMQVFGYDDAPEGHMEVVYNDVILDPSETCGGEKMIGRGFEILQARLGPGRLHHCMRTIGVATRALDLLLLRVCNPARKTFGKELREHGTILADIARSRADIDQARLLTLAAAKAVDQRKAKGALKEIGLAKFTVPTVALQVIDRAMQVHGAEGISQDRPLAKMYAGVRTLRYADGPDEVHLQQQGKVEIKERLAYLQDREARVRKAEAALGGRSHKL